MSYSINTILVPFDFSEIAEEGLNTAKSIAKNNNAKLILLHVVEYTQYVAAQSAVMGQVILANQELRAIAEEKLGKIKQTLSQEGYSVDISIKEGPVVICTVEECIQRNANLLITGTHGASGFREFFIGSNAYKFVKQVPCPVLTIPPGMTKSEFKNILFPIRIKSGGIEKYEFTRPLINKNYSRLSIVVYSEDAEQLQKLKESDSQKLKDQLEKEGIQYSIDWKITENISEHVLETAAAQNSDLIVVTSTLDYEIKDFFVGPFAQQIVNHAKVPVLNIRPSLVFRK